ncbi:MAG: DUF4142 domain-containing protein [Candidatus Cyclobacteriaceae bacterium M3_2C_046]
MKYKLFTFLLTFGLFFFSCQRDLSYEEALEKINDLEDPQKQEDATFLLEVYNSGLFVEKASQMASEKGYANFVVNFASKNLEYQQSITENLEELASDLKIKLPASLSTAYQEQLNQLSSLSKNEFDSRYLARLEEIYQEGLQKFENAALYAHLDEVRSWSAKYISSQRQQLDEIREIEAELL